MRSFIVGFIALFAAAPACAQALSPMTGEVKTHTNRFAMQLKAFNPYETAQRFRLAIYDEDGEEAGDVRSGAPVIYVPPGETVAFYVWGAAPARRRLNICVTSPYFLNGVGAQMRGEVCGRYDIVRVGR